MDGSIYRPAGISFDEDEMIHHLEGAGWFGDRWDDVKTVAKKVQSSSVVRGIEKDAVSAGSKALRGIAEVGLDGAAVPRRLLACQSSLRP